MQSIRGLKKSVADLHTEPIFSCLSQEEFSFLSSHIFLRQYKKGQILFYEGDARDRVFYLHAGLIRLEKNDPSANFCYIDYVKHNTFFPYGGLFTDEAYSYTAYAATDIVLYYVPASIFEEVVLGNKQQLLFIYKNLSRVLSYHEIRIRNTITPSASERIIQALAIWMEDLGEENEDGTITIPYPLTIIELAKMSGTTRETAGAVVKSLKADKAINYERKKFTFIDVNHFKDYLS